MIEQFGSSYSVHPFKSFGKRGASFEWQTEKAMIGISYIPEEGARWTYNLTIQKPFLESASPVVVAILTGLGVEPNKSMRVVDSHEATNSELNDLFE